eukprot:TRINITY_DN16823_c0_g1_i2.p1 TRINITY_DN16823_c0_g1~~TRINITY_DN16823_c0_g1_i2.p1  ORF type:complete len:103 (-),score=10.05 TRINITY_DN16823_c0_g1_i2:92-400(-)
MCIRDRYKKLQLENTKLYQQLDKAVKNSQRTPILAVKYNEAKHSQSNAKLKQELKKQRQVARKCKTEYLKLKGAKNYPTRGFDTCLRFVIRKLKGCNKANRC